MWKADDIIIEIDLVDDPVLVALVTTPAGLLEVIGEVRRVGRVLHVERAHVQGLSRGALGRNGLNAIARRVLEEADVDEIVIAGGARTTGRRQGRIPRPIRFPR